MNGLVFTKNGKPLRRRGIDLYSTRGTHVAQIIGLHAFDSRGRYVGTLVGKRRLVFQEPKRSLQGTSFNPVSAMPSKIFWAKASLIRGDEPPIVD